MQESIPSESGYVVEWQMADDAETDAVIDLSGPEVQVRGSELAAMPPTSRVPIAR